MDKRPLRSKGGPVVGCGRRDGVLLSASWALKGETLIKDILVPNSDSGRAHDAACTDTVLVNMMEAAVGRMQGWVGVTGSYWKR